MNTILFLNNGVVTASDGTRYDYKDGIYDNRNTYDTFVRWSGQLKNRTTDSLILDKQNYRYLGKVKEKLVFQPRDNDKILIVDLFIDTNNSVIPLNTKADIYDYKTNNGHKFMKFKMDCFTKLGLNPSGNWCSGIMIGYNWFILLKFRKDNLL